MRSPTDLARSPSDRPLPAPVATDDLDWLLSVLGTAPGPARPYLARGAGNELQLLVPATRHGVAAVLDRANDDRRPRQRAQALAGRTAARFGLVAALPGRRVELPPFALLGHLAHVLGRPGLGAVVTLGPRRRNRKPVLQLLDPDGTVLGFAKVGWSPLTTALVDNEAAILHRIEGWLPGGVTAPTIVHHGPWGTGSVAVASPLRLASNGRGRARAGTGAGLDLAALVRAIALCEPHPPTAVAAMVARAGWAEAGLGQDVDLDRLVGRHGDVELPLGLWHGDLTPWNLACGPGGTIVWDWEFAGTGRPVGFDLLHHRFERHRRRPGGTSRTALETLVAEAASVLAPLHPTGLPDRHREAMVDLYLCELLARERRLAGQRWPSVLADLAQAATELLQHRTGR